MEKSLQVKNGHRAGKLIDADELESYQAIKAAFRKEYPDLDGAADELLLHFLAFFTIKTEAAGSTKGGAKENFVNLQIGLSRIQGILKALGVRRDIRGKKGAIPDDEQEARMARFRKMIRDGKVPPVDDPTAEGVIIDVKDESESAPESAPEPADGIGEAEKKNPKNQEEGT